MRGDPQAEGGAPPSEEELRAALEEQMRRITVGDVLVQTAVTLVNLTGRRLGLATAEGAPPAEERDLEQARLGIEAVRALLPLVPGDAAPIRDALSQLQMAYAREAGAAGPAPGAGAEAGATEPAPKPGAPPAEDPERARARARIWTPPGA